MKIHSLLFFRDENGNLLLDYSSRMGELLSQLKSLEFIPNGRIKFPQPDMDEFKSALNQRQIVFIDNPIQLLCFAIPSKFGPFVNKFQEALVINSETKALFLPLIVEQKTIGLLGLYGTNLQEIDLKAGEIFNSQISVALENARLLAEVQRLAVTDELTCINNRRGLFEMGNRELSIAKRLNHPLAALMIDLDNFKEVNDKYGHAVGDIALREISGRIEKNIRDIDLVGRYGGEEFVVLLVGDDLPAAITVAERIRRAIGNEMIDTEAGPIKITVSIGVDELDSMTANLEMLIKRADRALYVAKHNGRDQVATLMNIENLQP
jgi:diguanylate cyclase (GGDEF)-like protein